MYMRGPGWLACWCVELILAARGSRRVMSPAWCPGDLRYPQALLPDLASLQVTSHEIEHGGWSLTSYYHSPKRSLIESYLYSHISLLSSTRRPTESQNRDLRYNLLYAYRCKHNTKIWKCQEAHTLYVRQVDLRDYWSVWRVNTPRYWQTIAVDGTSLRCPLQLHRVNLLLFMLHPQV